MPTGQLNAVATRREGLMPRTRHSCRVSESPISQIVGGQRPTKRARRSALPRSS